MKLLHKVLLGAGALATVTTGIALPAQADSYNGDGSYTTADGSWSCNMYATDTYSPCVQDTQTTGDESWQKGYKLTFNWTPLTNANGVAYTRCVLGYYNPQTQWNPSSLAPMLIDVPANWGTYTIPLAPYGWLQDGIVAGATTLKQEYYCYTPGMGASSRVDTVSALIPDMPPTQPTVADASSDNGVLTVNTGGSVALGVSPLEGYNVSVQGTDGQVVANTTVAPSPTFTAQATHTGMLRATHVANGANYNLSTLPTGDYVVKVSSYNSIGASDTVTTRVIHVVHNTKLGFATKLTVTRKHTTDTVTWTAPQAPTGAKVTGYTVSLRVGHTTRVLHANNTSVVFKNVKAGAYTLTVSTRDSQGNKTLTSIHRR